MYSSTLETSPNISESSLGIPSGLGKHNHGTQIEKWVDLGNYWTYILVRTVGGRNAARSQIERICQSMTSAQFCVKLQIPKGKNAQNQQGRHWNFRENYQNPKLNSGWYTEGWGWSHQVHMYKWKINKKQKSTKVRKTQLHCKLVTCLIPQRPYPKISLSVDPTSI